MDFDFDPCSVCNQEDGLYFCKLCVLRYCAEHLCLHLNVAWESNTWTSRNATERPYSNADVSNHSSSVEFNFGCLASSNASENDSQNEIPQPPEAESNFQPELKLEGKSLLSYTEEQLQAQLRFYQAQAKRIRNELERRAFALSPELLEAEKNRKTKNWRVVPRKATSKPLVTKAQRAAIEWLTAQIKVGVFTADQILSSLQQKGN